MSDYQDNLLAEPQDRQLIPVLPLRDVVVYPHMVIPLFVGREKSILALEAAMAANKKILLLAQKNAEVDDPGDRAIRDQHIAIVRVVVDHAVPQRLDLRRESVWRQG